MSILSGVNDLVSNGYGLPTPRYLSQTGLSREWSLVKSYAGTFFSSPFSFIKSCINPSFKSVPLHPLTKLTLATVLAALVASTAYAIFRYLTPSSQVSLSPPKDLQKYIMSPQGDFEADIQEIELATAKREIKAQLDAKRAELEEIKKAIKELGCETSKEAKDFRSITVKKIDTLTKEINKLSDDLKVISPVDITFYSLPEALQKAFQQAIQKEMRFSNEGDTVHQSLTRLLERGLEEPLKEGIIAFELCLREDPKKRDNVRFLYNSNLSAEDAQDIATHLLKVIYPS